MSRTFTRRTPIEQGLGEDPIYYFHRLYVQYLQGLFNFMPIGHFHWEPDEEETEIVITGSVPLNPTVAGKRPAIAVTMGPVQWSNLGFDNMLEYSFRTGKKTRADMMSGHLVVYCVTESDVLSMRLAHCVSHHTRVHQRILEGAGGFHQIGRPPPMINTPSPPGALVPGDPQNLSMVQVNVPFHASWCWSETPTSPQQNRSIEMITGQRRASDYPYASLVPVKRVQLALSVSPVSVRVLSGSASSIQSVEVTEGVDSYQTVSVTPED